MRHGLIATALALEELSDGKMRIEDEVTLYARVDSFDLLVKLSEGFEDQEQYELKSFGNVKSIEPVAAFRVRKTIIAAHVQYALTMKIRQPNTTARSETAVDISEDFFNQFKSVSYRGMKKRRYILPIAGRSEKWEIDVFPMQDGHYANWVKIDFEFSEGQPRELPPLPDLFQDIIFGNTQDKNEQDFIRSLYETVFMKQA